MQRTIAKGRNGLEQHGITNVGSIAWTFSVPALYEEAISRKEGVIADGGPFVARTGQHTGRSPNDKFIVREPSSEENIWWGRVNKPMDPDKFDAMHQRLCSYLQGRDLFVQECYAGADPRYRIRLRVITESAWHNLFARIMFLDTAPGTMMDDDPDFTIIQAPEFHAEPGRDGTNSDTVIAMNFAKKLVLIGGTSYAGEIKKSVFTLLNYLLPLGRVLSMHCSANVGPTGDVAIFFGLSGTGKTTLSADPSRTLVGDDEHGWSDHGIFNFEGGCYAKTIRLSKEAEPEIFETTRRFGTVLENVAIDMDDRLLNLDDDSLTENTRAAYPLEMIPNASPTGLAGHPSNIVFLTADAFGVMPPIAKLTTEQAMYHFLSGYTAKVAGTEKGLTEPQATFSTCFGAPFLALNPSVYAQLLGERIEQHRARVWLVNTGWSGGPYGIGKRMKIDYTRAMVRAALAGQLDDIPTVADPVFGFDVPATCPNVPDEVLNPRNTWSDKDAYDAQARKLAGMFVDNFKQFEAQATPAVRERGGPRLR